MACYLVIFESSVVVDKDDNKRQFNESIMEIITGTDGVVRILVEVKGSSAFPYCFHRSADSCALFCQFIQEVAL